MLQLYCDACNKELDKPGAILFGPPHNYDPFFPCSEKIHICVDCYEKLTTFIESIENAE
jgi:hypothetical protein